MHLATVAEREHIARDLHDILGHTLTPILLKSQLAYKLCKSDNKERKALRLAATGRKSSEIAAELFLSEGTVRNYLSDAIAKLNATNRIDAARIARHKGWL